MLVTEVNEIVYIYLFHCSEQFSDIIFKSLGRACATFGRASKYERLLVLLDQCEF